MRVSLKSCGVFAATLFLSACSSQSASTSLPQTPNDGSGATTPMMSSGMRAVDESRYGPDVVRGCPVDLTPGMMTCQVLRNKKHDVSGYGPPDLQSAYNLPSSTNGTGVTVAIADAFGYPTAESDLAAYRSNYGLPVCSTQNGCLKIMNQNGKPSHYPPNGGWDLEQATDMAMVSASCPNCNILLVQSQDNSVRNLGFAVKQAVAQGAHIVSKSTGAECSPQPRACQTSRFTYPGVVVLAAAGDGGYWGTPPANVVPAGLPTVVAVGGTALIHASNSRGWSETVWSGSGSGCTSLKKPAWQTDTGCKGRTGNDVAAVASPATPVAVYINGHFETVGGTSVASPLLAGVYALAGNAATMNMAQSLYLNTGDLYDVTSGSNGTCTPAYLCNGEVGYDGPTGNGTPNGIGAF